MAWLKGSKSTKSRIEILGSFWCVRVRWLFNYWNSDEMASVVTQNKTSWVSNSDKRTAKRKRKRDLRTSSFRGEKTRKIFVGPNLLQSTQFISRNNTTKVNPMDQKVVILWVWVKPDSPSSPWQQKRVTSSLNFSVFRTPNVPSGQSTGQFEEIRRMDEHAGSLVESGTVWR